MKRIATTLAWSLLFVASAFGQGSQRQAVAISLQGTPIPGANVWACQSGSTPNYGAAPPCALASIYSDPSLASQFLVAQPLHADGLGNYNYYAAAGAYVEVITGANTTGYSSTIVLPCAPNSTAAGCSGAAGNPGGSDTQLQINAHSEFGSVTGLGLDSSTTPSVLSIPFSESVKGPLPRVDATAYGADPTGATDSTTALANAAAAACNAGSTLFLPPGTYIVSQPQSPSTSPVIPIACAHIYVEGSGDQGTAQSEQPPQSKIVVANLGSSPNASPVFGFEAPTNSGSITIENVQISGYNQALSFYAATNVTLDNVCATAQSTGQPDNVPLKVTNVSSFRMTGGCLNSGSSSLPMALFTGEAALGSEARVDAFVRIEHVRGSGANFQYIQRVDSAGAIPGNFAFDDVTPTGSAADFLAITNATGHMGQTAMPQFGPVFVLNSSLPGSTGTGAVINFNSSGSQLVGVHIYDSGAGAQSIPPLAVRMTAGSLQDCEVHGAVGAIVEDASGNVTGSCTLGTEGGLDFVADGTVAATSRLRSEITTGANPTPNLRFYLSPNSRASYGVDAGQGFLFNDGASNGFNAAIAQAVKGSVDIEFATLFPPTNVSAVAATAGSLPAGTYYPFVGTTSNNCATVSAPSIAGPPVTLTGANNAISFTWTDPIAGASTAAGYCIAIASSAANANAGVSYAGAFVPGTGSTSGTLASVAGAMQFPMGNTLQAEHRFTSTSLGVNTTNPLYNLDVNGSAHVGGNMVLDVPLNPTGGGTGVSNPPASSIALGEGTNPFNFLNAGAALNGQVLVASNGGDPSFASAGIPERDVSGTSDSIGCDTATAISADRGGAIQYKTSGSATVSVPGENTPGCSQFGFKTVVSGAGTAAFTPSAGTITVTDGSLAASGLASLTLSSGQSATWLPDGGNYLVTVERGTVSAGTISINSATTGSHTFTLPFAAAPVCTVAPAGSSPPGTALSYAVSSSTTAITVTLSAGGTATFNWQCAPAGN